MERVEEEVRLELALQGLAYFTYALDEDARYVLAGRLAVGSIKANKVHLAPRNCLCLVACPDKDKSKDG